MSWLAEVFSTWWAAPIQAVNAEVDEPQVDDRSSMADFVRILRTELERDVGAPSQAAQNNLPAHATVRE